MKNKKPLLSSCMNALEQDREDRKAYIIGLRKWSVAVRSPYRPDVHQAGQAAEYYRDGAEIGHGTPTTSNH